MSNTRKIEHTAGGRTFEIQASVAGEWYVVQAFENGKPASFRYGVTGETDRDMMRQNGESAVDALIKVVKDDLSLNE